MRSTVFVLPAVLGLCLGGAGPTATHFGLIPFELDKPGQVSAAIYDAEGRLVRELLHAVPKTAGKQFMVWDGLDRDGNSVPAGEYTWKVLQTTGLKTTYVMSVGSNYPPGPDWPTACGPGTHSAPHGIAVDETGIYVAANTTENIETCVLKLTPDGKKRLWTALHPRPWDGALSLAVDGGELFMLGHVVTSDGRIEKALRRKQLVYVYDAATGKLAKRTTSGSAVGEIPVGIDVQWDTNNDDVDATDMDVRDGILLVAYAKRNSLRWYDAKSGKLLETMAIPSPQGVAVGKGGVVLVTTGDRVVSLSREKNEPVDVAKGLDKPGRIDVDRSTGDLLVYLAGTQQIQRLTSTGQLRQTYGEKGGRPDGLYDARTRRSFAGFADLCADGAGGFYITESTTAPRRAAHFAADGSVIREWYGGQRWAPHAAPEPGNPNVLWVGSQYGWIMRVLVDYEAKSWTVHSCYKYVGLCDGMVGDSHNEGCLFRVLEHKGTKYLAIERLPTLLKIDEKNWKLVPATVCGGAAGLPKEWKSDNPKHQSFQWNDANGDGMPQKAEFTYYDAGIPSSYEPYLAPDFSCYTASTGKEGRVVHRFPVTGWTEAGAPIYGTLPGGEVVATCPPRFDPNHFADSRWSVFLHQDPKTGRLYAALNDWTRDWCAYADSFMHQWTPKGKSTWTVGQRGQVPVLPGEVHMHLRGIAGVAHECVVAIDVNGGWNMTMPAATYVWDPDGLYVGGIMDAPNLDGIEKHWYQCGGEFCHASLHTLPSGDVLLYGNWENEVRIYRVSGWAGWTRRSGTIRLEKAVPSRTGQGLAVERLGEDGKLASVSVEPQIKLTSATATRWSGTLWPDYGPAYTGPWTVRSDKEFSGGTARGSRDNDASASVRFRGTSIRVVGVTAPNGGNTDFSLDDRPPLRVDTYSGETKRNVVLFERSGLPPGDHEVIVKVVGWYGRPRNKASSDSWVFVDTFLVDDKVIDDAGIEYTFSAEGDGRLWINRAPLKNKDGTIGGTIQLLRTPNAIQLNTDANGSVAVSWSSPFEGKQLVPTKCLYPVTPGGYTMENLRSPSRWTK